MSAEEAKQQATAGAEAGVPPLPAPRQRQQQEGGEGEGTAVRAVDAADWQETKRLLQELGALFASAASHSDVQQVAAIRRMRADLEAHYDAQIREKERLVLELNEKCAREEANTFPDDSEQQARMEELGREKESIAYEISTLTSEIEATRESIAALQAREKALGEECTSDEAKIAGENERARDTLKLYTAITRITWDYEADQNALAGWISDEANQLPKKFSVARTGKSKVQIADELWGTIESNLLREEV